MEEWNGVVDRRRLPRMDREPDSAPGLRGQACATGVRVVPQVKRMLLLIAEAAVIAVATCVPAATVAVKRMLLLVAEAAA